jgi:hypothetical protein
MGWLERERERNYNQPFQYNDLFHKSQQLGFLCFSTKHTILFDISSRS